MINYRERTRYGESRDTRTTVFLNGAPSPGIYPPYYDLVFFTPRVTERFERFWFDDGSSWSNGYFVNKTKWKPCQHYTRWLGDPVTETPWTSIPWSILNFAETRTYINRPGGEPDRLLAVDSSAFRNQFGAFGDHVNGLPSMMIEASDKRFIPPPTGLSSLVEQSLKQMVPRMKKELSLINSIIELKDLRTLYTTLANVTKFLGRLGEFRSALKKSVPPTRKGRKPPSQAQLTKWGTILSSFENRAPTLRELLQLSADAYLSAEFALMPMIRDICGIYSAVVNVQKRLNRLLARSGRPRRMHFTYSWIPSQFTGATQSLTYLLNLGQFAGSVNTPGYTAYAYRSLKRQITMTRTVLVERPAVFHAEADYCFHFSQYQTENTRLLGMLDSLGVNLDPSIVWNAIPWSFLVDWLVDVGQWLAKRKVLNMEPSISISRYLWSWEYWRRIRCSFKDNVNDPLSTKIHTTYLPDLYEQAYRRDIELPSRTNSLYGSGLSDKELSLGVALTISRAFKPNRRLRVK